MTERETVIAAPPANAKAGLFKKIMMVMSEVEYIPKRGKNTHFKYDYVTEADVVDFLRQLMVKHGLAMLPMEVESFSESKAGSQRLITATLIFTLADTETGETISSRVVAEGSDTGDKAFYKAYAGGLKYWLMKTFMVPTGDDPERDTPGQGQNQGQSQPRQQPTQARPAAPQQRTQVPQGQRTQPSRYRDTDDRSQWG